ncbi:MAG TPA: hypothetical protein VFK97_01290, partial [Candidatus Saccharimonadales bacterium]|nr:hypothetical protein [Candidatus Saccharimonadales bacterium]
MQDNKKPIAQPPASNLVPDIVKNIPVAAPDNLQPADDDDELDKLMRDVSQDVKKIGQKAPKRHWFSRQKKVK